MSTNTAIRPGFPWAAEIEYAGESFPPTASFRAQFRIARDAPVLLDVTSIARLSETVLRLDLTPAQTQELSTVGAVFFDIARTDLTEPDLLPDEFEADVRPSFTRDL